MKSESKNNQPKISVIIPTYNRAHLIGRAIKSVLNQTYQDFEVIVVDDGSTDNTQEIIKKFQEQDKGVRNIRHEKNNGSAAARNSGIKAAKGEYIAFQDSDDEWLPEKLYKHMMIFKKVEKKIGVVYSGFWKIRNGKKLYIPSPHVFQKEGNIHKELLKGNFIGMPASVVRKECFTKIGNFDIKIPHLEDWELWIRISKYYEFKYIPEPLMISYYIQGSVNEKSILEGIRVLDFIIKKHYEDFNKNKKLLSKHMYYIGSFLCLNYNFPEGKKYLIEAVKNHPTNIKFLLKVFISFFGQSVFRKIVRIYKKLKK